MTKGGVHESIINDRFCDRCRIGRGGNVRLSVLAEEVGGHDRGKV